MDLTGAERSEREATTVARRSVKQRWLSKLAAALGRGGCELFGEAESWLQGKIRWAAQAWQYLKGAISWRY